MHRAIAFSASLLLLAGCASSGASRSVTVEDQAQCPLTLDLQQELILTLPANPTTGYRWVMRDEAEQVLESLGPEVHTSDNEQLVGSPGQSTWRFRAKAYGEGRLLLEYQRPWEPESATEQRFVCELRVR